MGHRISATAVLALALAGCASEGYEPEEARRRLRDAGFTSEQADCVVEALDHAFGFDALNTRDEPTREQRAELNDVLADCGVPGE